ncbi:hypothetical protein [Spirosoma utsteinense]|uniref:Uncharacterized protein n=1 Tax=Spirosoma utsteinense TaxID=2585773 RepID=A0ABR6WA86_9BACT|nr:hypothetical protein [Spirosoma utsteinense]MBC3784051.1 hypothetical protein [Spirosoma utsteinense]MBC3793460.1 hypothetical protein [Spirosoma utsteinense]
MKDEKDIERDDAQIIGRTEGPMGSDDTDVDRAVQDNKNRPEVEESANGLDSVQIRSGQDGRNIRGIGGMDMDSKNGVLRMGDMDDTTMDVTEEGISNAGSDKTLTKTAMIDVNGTSDTVETHEYSSVTSVEVPNAQMAPEEEDDNADEEETSTDEEQTEREEDVAETGTDLNNQPSY